MELDNSAAVGRLRIIAARRHLAIPCSDEQFTAVLKRLLAQRLRPSDAQFGPQLTAVSRANFSHSEQAATILKAAASLDRSWTIGEGKPR